MGFRLTFDLKQCCLFLLVVKTLFQITNVINQLKNKGKLKFKESLLKENRFFDLMKRYRLIMKSISLMIKKNNDSK